MQVEPSAQFADFATIEVGQAARLVRTITREDIRAFADLTGDVNPLHLDDEFGARTRLGASVAHGMLSASLISTVIGTMLPGPGALWLSQSLDFLLPVRAGDTVSVETCVVKKFGGRRLLELETHVRNQHGRIVISGKSKVQLLEEKVPDSNTRVAAQVALVTGAGTGIGAAVARALAASGLKTAVVFRQSEQKASAVVEMIAGSGGCAIAVQADLRVPDSIRTLFDRVESELGPVDILVNNGWPESVLKSVAETSWADFADQIVGFEGAYRCAMRALPGMVERKFGRIVTIGSIAVDSAPPSRQSAYVSAKAAVTALTRSIAVEYGPYGITANIVAPGMTDTGFLIDMPQKAKLVAEMQTPTRRLAQPEDIAEAVAFLASSAARHVTGETIRVCGGSVML